MGQRLCALSYRIVAQFRSSPQADRLIVLACRGNLESCQFLLRCPFHHAAILPIATARCGRGFRCDINSVVKPLYRDSPAARLRYSQTLAASANNPKSKLSKADREELRRLAAMWAATVKPARNPKAKYLP